MFWKSEFSDSTFKSSEFLKLKTRKAFLSWRLYPGKGGARGITCSKKEEILKKLSPFLMIQNKVKFWQDLPSSSNAKDLTINIEHLSKE